MKKLRIQHRKERFMRTIKIETCGQCPFSAVLYQTTEAMFLGCYHKHLPLSRVNLEDRTIKKGDPIPTWCPIPDTEVT